MNEEDNEAHGEAMLGLETGNETDGEPLRGVETGDDDNDESGLELSDGSSLSSGWELMDYMPAESGHHPVDAGEELNLDLEAQGSWICTHSTFRSVGTTTRPFESAVWRDRDIDLGQ